MVRKMGIEGTIPQTSKRSKSEKLRKRKVNLGIDCFFTVSNASQYVDDEVLQGL